MFFMLDDAISRPVHSDNRGGSGRNGEGKSLGGTNLIILQMMRRKADEASSDRRESNGLSL